MELMPEFTARIHYYCREGYYKSMENVTEQGLEKFPNDAVLKLYRGLSYLLQKQTSEALRFLSPLLTESRVGLGGIIAATMAHRNYVNVDSEEVTTLENKLKEGRKNAKPEEFYFAGVVLYLTEKFEKAKEYLDRAIKNSNQQHLEALCLRGWVEISSPTAAFKENKNTNPPKNPSDYFDSILATNRKHIESHLGLAKYYETVRDFEQSIDNLNALLAYYPNWIPALLEKMKVSVSNQDWDQAMELANRVLSTDSNNLEAIRMKLIYSLCREGNIKQVYDGLDSYFNLCSKLEPRNPKLFNENGQMFSQLGSYEPQILEKSLKFAKYATELDFESDHFISDVGKVYLLMKRYKDARQQFVAASNMNNASLAASYGLICCQLAEGNVELASEQLNFLRELSSTIESTAELAYLSAIIAKKENKSAEEILTNLNQSVERHMNKILQYPFNLTYLKVVNPDFVLRIVKEYLLFVPQEPIAPGMLPPVAVRQASIILEPLMKVCPAHRDAMLISAQIKYLSGDFMSALNTLNKLLKLNSSGNELTDVHLLLAQVQLAKNEFDEAEQTLEIALSHNFKIRDYPKYHLLLGQVQLEKKEGRKAKKTLENALELVEEYENKFKVNEMGDGLQGNLMEFTLADKFSLYIAMISVLRLMNLDNEANSIMKKAMEIFKGTHLEGRLSLTGVEDLIEKGDSNAALEILKNVLPSQHHYIEAKKLMADIYLNIKKDKKAYTACFLEIVKENQTPANLVLLGDAYMEIQEPGKAIEAYEIAVSKNPHDLILASKMGQALVKAHQFRKAISYYQEATKSDENFQLRIELANLQYNLRQWDGADKTIQQALLDLKDTSINRQVLEVELLVLLAKVQRGATNFYIAFQTLIKAKDAQSRCLKRALLEQPSVIEKMKSQYGKICILIGETAERTSDIEYAVKSLKEGMDLCPTDSEVLSTLCKIYMKIGDFSHCQQCCMQLQTLKPNSDADVMLGELCYRKADFINSIKHFQSYLDKHPVHWKSLEWFIEGSRRAGSLTETEPYLKNATSRCDPNDPALGYCQGLYEWFSGNINSALKMFNKARKDPIYGQKALLAIVEIYLNPTGVVLGGDALESTSGESIIANGGSMDAKDLAPRTVETLLRELTIKSSEDKFKRQILECCALLITRNKNKMEKAVQELSGLVTTDIGRESVMLVHALATAYMLMKQVPRARNQLKRIVKASWTIEEAEYLEKCWLLLADIHIQASKYDLATDLIKKVLQFNKSCIKANEYLGLIMEKEQAYADAAINYEQAWKLSNSANPAIGYKLAFNYLKAKRYTDAIDICHIVLGKHPNYPKIKKDILDKARSSLRM